MFVEIPIEKIHASRFRIRLSLDKESLRELAESLKRDGQLRPIMVRPHPEVEGHYELIFGLRTLEAAKMAGLKTLLARVEEVDDEEAMWIQYVENEYRRDVSDYERARWLRMMMDKFGYTQTELAEKLKHLSQPRISRLLKMLELEAFMPTGILLKISERQARAILSANKELRLKVCKWIEREIERNGEPPTSDAIEAYINDLEWERKLIQELGEKAEETSETEVEVEKTPAEKPEEVKPQESPQEFIRRTKELWPGATDEFIINTLISRFSLSEDEARKELEDYYREKYGPSTPKIRIPRGETVKCPVCGRAVDAIDVKVKIEELREFEPELRACDWLEREAFRRM